MSTKVTISYSKDHHLYQEIFDVSNVYVEISGYEFEANNKSTMIQIPIKAWRAMVKDGGSRGWPESEDNSEKTIAEEWLNPPAFMSGKESDEAVIFNKRSRNEKD
jgi:hypothetical protein